MAVTVVVRPEALDDIRRLGSSSLKLEVSMYLLRLERSPWLGQPLHDFSDTGDLSDCRKLYVGDRTHRIVYRLLPDESAPTTVDVIAVGERELLQVYVEAARRLER